MNSWVSLHMRSRENDSDSFSRWLVVLNFILFVVFFILLINKKNWVKSLQLKAYLHCNLSILSWVQPSKNDLLPGTVSDCLGYTWRKQKQTFSCPRRWWGNDGIRELPGARDQQGRDHADQLPRRLQQKQWIAFLWGNCIGDWGGNGVKFRISAVIIDNFSNDHHRKNPVCTSRRELYLEEHVANKTIFIFKTKTISLSITNVLLSQTRLSVRERW